MDAQELTVRGPLLLYLSHAGDAQRLAVGPALAAASERAGWGFELYYGTLRRGRHFGGGETGDAEPGVPSGSLAAGGRHAEQVLRLAIRCEVVALGDPDCILWPALEAAGAEALLRSLDPAELYAAAFERLGQPLPARVLVLDARPQGAERLCVAPYLYPEFLSGPPALGIEVGCDAGMRGKLEALGATEYRGLQLAPDRAAAFRGGLDGVESVPGETYAAVTSSLGERHADWGKGVLLGDPDLVAAQLPKARRLRLLPLYGQPQTAVIRSAADLVRAAAEPVFGRQYDDHDFFELAKLGRGLQLVDPDPPFDAAGPPLVPAPSLAPVDLEPADEELEAWAEEGRVAVTLLLWSGMLRELDCVPRAIDLVAETGLAAGLVLTAQSLAHGEASSLELLAAPTDRGGVLGRLEPLLASTGHGVAPESFLPDGVLEASLGSALENAAAVLPPALVPRGWWPLLDAPLVPSRSSPVGLRGRRPVLRFSPRGSRPRDGDPSGRPPSRRDLRSLAGAAVRRFGLESAVEARRPFDRFRPGAHDPRISETVRNAGFSYMWSKAGFGAPRVVRREGDFVVLSQTAGNWDGWSPFYTVAGRGDLARAERRLLAAKTPGWLVGTIDCPLWLLSGEVLRRGAGLHAIAELAARGGESGRLANVTPNVIARYARILDGRRA